MTTLALIIWLVGTAIVLIGLAMSTPEGRGVGIRRIIAAPFWPLIAIFPMLMRVSETIAKWRD